MSDYWSALLLETLHHPSSFCFSILTIPFPLRREWLRTCASRRSARTGRGWMSWIKCGRRTSSWRTSSRPCSPQTCPSVSPLTPAWPRTRGSTGRSVQISPCCRMDVVLMTDVIINILGTSKTKYKSRRRKERARTSAVGGQSKPFVWYVFWWQEYFIALQIITETNKQQQRQISEWPSAQCESVHVVKIVIMSTFLTDPELPSASIQPHDTLWLFLL